MQKLKIIVPLLALIFLAGCTQTMNLTPSARYYSALKVFDDNIESYLTAYRTASPETQAKWKATIDPLIIAANQALQTWRLSVGTANAAQKEQVWQEARTKVIAALVQNGIIKVEDK